jgi:hypothetical protein
MTKASGSLQELKRKIYSKVKADFGWKRWSREEMPESSTGTIGYMPCCEENRKAV